MSPAEHEAAGLPYGSARERVDHLRRTVGELDRLLGSHDLPRSGPHSAGVTAMPRPVQPRCRC